MRRKDREVTDIKQIKEIIDKCDVVRIGLCDGEYPYIVPLNFGCAFEDGQICFYVHGAEEGRKVELMRRNGVCSFEMDCAHKIEILHDERSATMRYKCLMGKARIELLKEEDKARGLAILMGGYKKTADYDYDRTVPKHTMVAKLTVTEYSAKINASEKEKY